MEAGVSPLRLLPQPLMRLHLQSPVSGIKAFPLQLPGNRLATVWKAENPRLIFRQVLQGSDIQGQEKGTGVSRAHAQPGAVPCTRANKR